MSQSAPAGNARIGDIARYVGEQFPPHTGRPHTGTITKIGLINAHGYPLNIEVTPDNPEHGAPFITDPFCVELTPTTSRAAHEVRVVLEPADLRKECLKLWKQFHTDDGSRRFDIRILRWPVNSDDFAYRLMCDRCYRIIVVHIETVEIADLTFSEVFERGDGPWCEHEPDVDACNSRLICGCETGPDAGFTYDSIEDKLERY